MLSYRSINAVTASLQALLLRHLVEDATLRPFFDGGTMSVSPRTPEEMAEAGQNGVSLWLYLIARDPDVLNNPPRRLGPDRVEPERLPLRLHYLMTAVVNTDIDQGNDPGLEQLIIGKVLQVFHDHPHLSGPDLLGDLQGRGESVRVRLEPLGLDEITRVWEALGASYQLCISYEVSVVMVWSDAAVAAVSPVDSVAVEMARITEATP